MRKFFPLKQSHLTNAIELGIAKRENFLGNFLRIIWTSRHLHVKISVLVKAPERKSEGPRPSTEHGSRLVPKKTQTTLDVVEVECTDHLAHRCEDGDAIDILIWKINRKF